VQLIVAESWPRDFFFVLRGTRTRRFRFSNEVVISEWQGGASGDLVRAADSLARSLERPCNDRGVRGAKAHRPPPPPRSGGANRTRTAARLAQASAGRQQTGGDRQARGGGQF